MTLTPRLRKCALIAHIASSVGWLGAVTVFLALAVVGLASQDTQKVRAVYLAMEPATWFAIVPLAFASLLTGLTVSLGTKWGLFQHYWILAKFLINTAAIIILLLHTRLIAQVASAAAESAILGDELRGPRIQLVAIASAAMAALLSATTLAVFKPRGLTPRGQRRQRSERREQVGETQIPASAVPPEVVVATTGGGLSAGLKILLAIVGVMVALAIALHLGGGHGRRGH